MLKKMRILFYRDFISFFFMGFLQQQFEYHGDMMG